MLYISNLVKSLSALYYTISEAVDSDLVTSPIS